MKVVLTDEAALHTHIRDGDAGAPPILLGSNISGLDCATE